MNNLACWAATHRGHVRANNEDHYAVSAIEPGRPVECWQGELPSDFAWAIVADGMGGHAAGEVASALAVTWLRPEMDGLRGPADVAAAINRVNARIGESMAADPDLEGMGTTIVAALLRSRRALVFNVGDSRAYRWSEGRLLQISEDHAVGGHLLTQCLGGSRSLPMLAPAVAQIELEPGDRLVLCTDGLTGMLSDEAIGAILTHDREGPAEALVEAALAAGGADNVTVVVIETS